MYTYDEVLKASLDYFDGDEYGPIEKCECL